MPEPVRNLLWHDLLVEQLLLRPAATNEELSESIGLDKQTIAIMRRTDMFQLKLERRKEEIFGASKERILEKLEGKLARLADKAVDTLTDQIDRERAKMHESVQRGTLETTEMVLASMGFLGRRGAVPAGPPSVNIAQAVIVDNTMLEAARQKMRALHAQHPEAVEEVGNPALLPRPA